jgi:hypothetical protein
MSSTVGYGVELDTKIFDGDAIWDIESSQPNLHVSTSSAEYGDEERSFLFVKTSVTTAGSSDNTAAFLPFLPIDTTELDAFIAEHEGILGEPGWFLVDYYVYS